METFLKIKFVTVTDLNKCLNPSGLIVSTFFFKNFHNQNQEFSMVSRGDQALQIPKFDFILPCQKIQKNYGLNIIVFTKKVDTFNPLPSELGVKKTSHRPDDERKHVQL